MIAECHFMGVIINARDPERPSLPGLGRERFVLVGVLKGSKARFCCARGGPSLFELLEYRENVADAGNTRPGRGHDDTEY